MRRAFGEPIDRDGVTVVPVAVSIGGGGNAPANQGSGGGFGGMVRGIGAYSISKGQVRFIPAVDTTAPRRCSSLPSESPAAPDDGGGLTKARGDSSA